MPDELPLTDTVATTEPVKRGAELLVTLAGGTVVQLLAEVTIANGVRAGTAVTDADLRRMIALDHELRARTAGLRMLARYPRSSRDLGTRLARRGFAPAAVDAAVARLETAGLLDDEAFARRYVDVRSSQPRGRRLLVQELRQRGIGDELAREAVTEVDDVAAAFDAGRRRATHIDASDRNAFFRRLGTFLQRRGFNYETSRTVIETLWRESATSDAGA